MDFNMKIVAIVQARMGSTRLPNKVMKPINNTPMIEILLNRLSQSKKIDEIIIATSNDPRNQSLVTHVSSIGYRSYLGNENDVLDRFLQAAIFADADIIVRITGDCPLIDPALVDQAIETFLQTGVDYLSNASEPSYPDGLDTEVFLFQALKQAWNETDNLFDREHVTPYLRTSGKFKQGSLRNDIDHSNLRLTVDEPEDFEVVKNIFQHFSPDLSFSWRAVLELSEQQPSLFTQNQHLTRNEGATMGTGQKLWKRAKQVIPGGNMLLSKRAEMFLPEKWPAYFSKAKGCQVTDLDGVEYYDMCIMGIGTNSLGYGNEEVDAAVLDVVKKGNMSTLNCPEEVYLAEKLVEMHPWADMVRLARSGGEANAVAIRIARAASQKDNVAICGYHGWHDWYLSANLGDEKKLDGHLLPGLEPNGVPRNLKGSVYPFNYNDFEGLEALVTAKDIGVIKMEVMRSEPPKDGFLEKVRQLATDKNIVLIFDECTSGFRETYGGLHLKYGVEPDMAMFGKALGNGYAITGVIGRREIMEAAQDTFISSTFWTERVGPVAALTTLEVMERTKSWDKITEIGKGIRVRWQSLANKYGLEIDIWGLPSLTGYTFKSGNSLIYKTLATQEMLAKGYLTGNSVYVCTEHNREVIDGYFENLDPVFALIAECEQGRDVMSLLNSPVCHNGFKRLN